MASASSASVAVACAQSAWCSTVTPFRGVTGPWGPRASIQVTGSRSSTVPSSRRSCSEREERAPVQPEEGPHQRAIQRTSHECDHRYRRGAPAFRPRRTATTSRPGRDATRGAPGSTRVSGKHACVLLVEQRSDGSLGLFQLAAGQVQTVEADQPVPRRSFQPRIAREHRGASTGFRSVAGGSHRKSANDATVLFSWVLGAEVVDRLLHGGFGIASRQLPHRGHQVGHCRRARA